MGTWRKSSWVSFAFALPTRISAGTQQTPGHRESQHVSQELDAPDCRGDLTLPPGCQESACGAVSSEVSCPGKPVGMADQCEGESPKLGGRKPLCCLPHFPGLPRGSFPLGLQKRGVLFSPPAPHQAQRSAVTEKNPLEFVRQAGEASPYEVQDRGAVLSCS